MSSHLRRRRSPGPQGGLICKHCQILDVRTWETVRHRSLSYCEGLGC